MSIFVSVCPRCDAQKMTFDVAESSPVRKDYIDYNKFRFTYEAFCICRGCKKTSILVFQDKEYCEFAEPFALANLEGRIPANKVNFVEHISIKDEASQQPPEYVPDPVAEIFTEGATCLSTHCHNAAGAMFRLCLDLVTKEILGALEENDLLEKPNHKVQSKLYYRLEWLFANGHLPDDLKDFADCVRQDGNDGAHDGTLAKAEAEALMGFTVLILKRVYTNKKEVELLGESRKKRKSSKN